MTTYDVAVSSLKEKIKQTQTKNEVENYKVLPARVTSTKDYTKLQCVSVEILISDIYETKNSEDAGTIKLDKVFVNLPRFGGWKFRFPVQTNDLVTVHWSNKDLSKFLDSVGSPVSQNVNDYAGFEDCYVTFEGGTRKNHNNPHLKNLEIEGPSTKLTITPEGNITTTTSGNIKCTAKGSYDITASELTIHNDVTIKSNLSVEGNTTTDGTTTTSGSLILDEHYHSSPESGNPTSGPKQ